MRSLNLQSKKVRILIGVLVVIMVIVAVRIVMNIMADRERAARMAQSKAVAVVLERPVRRTIEPQLSFTGSLDPVWQAQVAAKVDGRLEKVYVNEGDRVEKGQELAILERTDTDADLLNAQGNYAEAAAGLSKAERDLARYQRLFTAGAVSQQTLDDYVYARNSAQAQVEAARGILRGMESKSQGTVLVAPEGGIIAKRYYQEGYYAKAATAIFSVADISRLKTVIHVPEGNISAIAVGNKAQIILPAYDNKTIVGQITRIAPVADLPSHMFATEISVDNSEGLRAGIYARVELKAEPKQNVLTIPNHAIVMRGDQKTVFCADSKGVVTRKVLDIGYRDEQYSEVLSGLSDEDVIVTEGHNKLREGSQVDMEKAGIKQ